MREREFLVVRASRGHGEPSSQMQLFGEAKSPRLAKAKPFECRRLNRAQISLAIGAVRGRPARRATLFYVVCPNRGRSALRCTGTPGNSDSVRAVSFAS